MRFAFRVPGVLLAATLATALVASCKEATTITLVVTTDIGCANLKGVAISASTPGEAEQVPPAVVTLECDGAEIGSLAIVPANEPNARVGVKVVGAVDGNVDTCAPANDYRGCVVARRRMQFVEHKSLRLPIALNLVCKNVPCDQESTCAAAGRCVSSTVSETGELAPKGADGSLDDGSVANTTDSGATSNADARADGGSNGPGTTYSEQSCRALHAAFPSLPNGNYRLTNGLRFSGYVDVSCDMTTVPFGWTLVLQYHHKGGTSPDPLVLPATLPIYSGETFGIDGFGTAGWGHADPVFMASLSFSVTRFFCAKPGGPVIHVSTSACAVYFRTGFGGDSCSGIQTLFIPLTGHGGALPADATFFNTNQGTSAMTSYPFSQAANANSPAWHITGGNYQCDDYGNDLPHSIHRIWVY